MEGNMYHAEEDYLDVEGWSVWRTQSSQVEYFICSCNTETNARLVVLALNGPPPSTRTPAMADDVRSALEFYADNVRYEQGFLPDRTLVRADVLVDRGQRARTALATLNNGGRDE